jgi:protoporphyrinogen oxidase
MAAAGRAAVVLEREEEPGGVCRTLERGGYAFDHTGHLLHVGRPETERYLEELGLWSELAVWERRAAIAIGEHVTPYPIQIHTHGLAPEVRRDCLLGFVRAWAAGAPSEAPASFREWVLERFGDGLAQHFFFPYNSKLYRARPEELSLDWVGRYVPKPGLEEVVDGALGLHRDRVGYNAVFRYPASGGIRRLPDAVAARVPALRTGCEVIGVHLGEHWLETAAGERVAWDRLVATLSLPALLDRVLDPLPEEIRAARRVLRWVRVLNVALGVRGPAPRPEHWLYLPDADQPAYRVGFPSNHGRLAPDGCHTVSLEVSLDPGTGDAEQLAAAAEGALAARGWLDPEAVEVRLLTMVDPAYVVFDHARKHAVASIRSHLGAHGVLLSGRWAEWKYSAMEDAILDGMAVARRLG